MEVLYRRQTVLQEEYLEAAATSVGKQAFEMTLGEVAPAELVPPSVHGDFRDQCSAANALPVSTRRHLEHADEETTYTLEDRGDTLVVSPGAHQLPC